MLECSEQFCKRIKEFISMAGCSNLKIVVKIWKYIHKWLLTWHHYWTKITSAGLTWTYVSRSHVLIEISAQFQPFLSILCYPTLSLIHSFLSLLYLRFPPIHNSFTLPLGFHFLWIFCSRCCNSTHACCMFHTHPHMYISMCMCVCVQLRSTIPLLGFIVLPAGSMWRKCAQMNL